MNMATGAPTRPALRYHGGKWKLCEWIISHLPAHEVYVEPFGGAMSVLLAKPRVRTEVYNDQWDRVVAFFRVLREQPNDLCAALAITPWSRAEYELSYEVAEDDLENARRLFVQSWQGIGGLRGQDGTKGRRGWRYEPDPRNAANVCWNGLLANLYRIAFRLRAVHIECDDAINVIRRYDGPGVLYYVDPPYLADTRRPGHQQAYFAEMAETNHVWLAKVLHGVAGGVVVSGYDSDLYRELYRDWRMETLETQDNSHARRTEVLWIKR